MKLRFFGCPGYTSIVFDDVLADSGCDDGSMSSKITPTVNSSVSFVDCDCFDDATDVSSSSFGDISSCALFDYDVLGHTSSHVAASSFDLCLVSTTDNGNGSVANFSHPMPEIIGLEHLPNGNTPFCDSVTFFETTCDETGVDSLGNFAFPLFPGYGKFAGTCPNNGKLQAMRICDFAIEKSRLQFVLLTFSYVFTFAKPYTFSNLLTGFIDFENENSRLPDDIVFFGQPPSTSFFYQFIDGTSVGFWPNVDNHSDVMNVSDRLFFDPTFARCDCLDCNTVDGMMPSDLSSPSPTSDPMSPTDGTPQQPDFGTHAPSASFSDVPSRSPSATPSVESSGTPSTLDPSTSSPFKSTVNPSFLPSEKTSEELSSGPTMKPSINPSESPSASYHASIAPSDYPSLSMTPFVSPSTNPSEHHTESPSIHSSLSPSENPSESPSASYYPSIAPSDSPSLSIAPSISPSTNPSEHHTESPSIHSSLSPSENRSESPSASYFPSIAPSDSPSVSIAPSISPSTNPSEHPSDHPTQPPSEVASSNPSVSPTIFQPITYRCPPTIVPTHVNGPVTPSPVEIPVTLVPTVSTESPTTGNPSSIPTSHPTISTESPTTDSPSSIPTSPPTVSTESPTTGNPSSIPTSHPTISTESPTTDSPSSIPTSQPTVSTESPTTSNPSSIPTSLPTISTESPTEMISTEFPTGISTTSIPTESHTDVDCVDETECFIFAVGNCVDKHTNTICIPHLNGGFRRYLEDQIRFHQAALAEELLHHK